MTFFSDLFEGKNYGNLCKEKSLLSFIDSNLKFLKVLKAEYECARARLNQREFGLRNFPNTLNPYIKTKCGSSHIRTNSDFLTRLRQLIGSLFNLLLKKAIMSLKLLFLRHSLLSNAKKEGFCTQNKIKLLSSLTFFTGIRKLIV
ncbi:hypothetical protein LSS_18623 [Leptospira santarosai serovar Shermani str. LT 821]|uniref:Uncharacterized protein n=1 Tax=Leptospira santarosai serovar Shermani str. LT 821 TaxID=758847 RepID=K8Y5Y7_9LEPT|nr:hypothetical protein LSS_18623 [Leptospira santarosai serovar Shermani str. LT 821]